MKHLTVDEIIDFVSLTELNSEAVKLSATVNGHICRCRKCLKLVTAFQTVYDEFVDANAKAFNKQIIGDILREKAGKEAAMQMQRPTQTLDGY